MLAIFFENQKKCYLIILIFQKKITEKTCHLFLLLSLKVSTFFLLKRNLEISKNLHYEIKSYYQISLIEKFQKLQFE